MRLALFIFLAFLSINLCAQPPNDDCLDAILIPSTNEWCSELQEFTNVDATADPEITAALQAQIVGSCVNHSFENGIWFIFFAEQPGILITTDCGIPNGFCIRPRPVLFTGSCTASSGLNFIECTPGGSVELSEFTITGLTIGQRYYLYVESEDPGTMQLCLDDFVPVPSPESDCSEAVVLCDKSPFQVEFLNTSGNNTDELVGFEDRCLRSEMSSAWYKWTCKDPGSLTFTLTPNNFIDRERESDDLDFAVFELPGGLDDCIGKEMVRCMASGGCQQEPYDAWKICNGPTGLATGSTDTDEFQGCSGPCSSSLPGQPGNQLDDNFISPLNMVAGRSYAFLVNNFTESGRGFSIEFGGTGTFQGPEPNFEPIPQGDTLACDKLVDYTDLSIPGPDPIVSWSWNFGAGANPPTSNMQNPDPVSYDSFGDKSATLTVETSRGCLVTRIIDVRVGACCEDFDPPILETNIEAALCPGEEEAIISYEVNIGGSEEFTYNVSPVNPPDVFLPNPSISGLGAGDYTVIVQDIKGCRDTNIVTIEEFPPVFVNAGMDIELELGSQDILNATIDPPGSDVTYAWTSTSSNATISECLTPGLDCIGSDSLDCFDPIVTAQGTQTFTVIITDENGCTSSDQVTVTTNVVRPIYAPTAMGDVPGNRNDVFRLGFGRQVKRVSEFHIFDRWGNIIYTDTDIDLDADNEMSRGWDGRFGDQTSRTTFVNPGVYVWYAKVLFIDGELLPYAGDVTIVR